MIADASYGFAEHGHLYGTPALVVRLSDPEWQPLHPRQVTALAARHPDRLVYLFVDTPAGLPAAGSLATGLSADGFMVAACIRPGMRLPAPDRLSYASVLRVTAGDWDALDDVDDRVGSVSVHAWPGAAAIAFISARVPAPFGRFLHLSGADVGHAKVWLRENQDSHWRLTPPHPLNDELEPAELAEMAAATLS